MSQYIYEYDFDGVPGVGDKAALAIPTSRFNGQAHLASHVMHFVADAKELTRAVETTSDRIIAFRAVPDFSP